MPQQLLYCAGCNANFKAKSYDPNKTYPCPKCKQPLKPKGEADTSAGGVTLDTQGRAQTDKGKDPLVGQKIAQYRIVKKLGQGGMGSVYEAKHLELGRSVALKILSPKLAAEDPDSVERFKREARAAAVLEHPNVVTTHAVGSEGDHHFIELQLIDGESLQARVQREKGLPVAEATRIILGAANALGAGHEQNIVHRDIKPGNIMLTKKGQVKVMDFGLAKDVTSSAQLTVSGHIMGTPHYMSPEQCDGAPLDGRADIYSLGATYYAILAGQTPYQGTSLLGILKQQAEAPVPDVREKCPEAPKSVQRVIKKAMAKKADDRYATCAEMIADLEAVLAEVEASDGPAVSVRRAKAPKPVLVLAGVLGVAAILVVGQMALSNRGKEEAATTEPASTTGDADARASVSPEPPVPKTAVKREAASAQEALSVPAPSSASKPSAGATREGESFGNSTDGSEMVYVPAGTFKMGGQEEKEGGMVHDVHVDAFHVSKYETTNRQFKEFVDANPEWRKDRIKKEYHNGDYLKHWEGDSYPSDKADYPVVCVSWFAARAYCEWAGVRLPTEAEWEYACRAGSTGKYCFGDDKSKLKDYAWYKDNSDGSTHPVGQKKPNDWGIHDMHGNVWEWCSSKYQPYPRKADDGREDLGDPGSRRVVRGGGWSFYCALYCRSALRYSISPTYCYGFSGFRVFVSARAPASPRSSASGTPANAETPAGARSSAVPVASVVPKPTAEATDAAAMVDFLLRITPADAEVSIDGESVELKARGRVASLRLQPGRHTLRVHKDGYAPLEKVLEVAPEDTEGEVTLARILQQVTVHMKSGRKMEGGLVARAGNKITITQGRGEVTLTDGQYDRFELGETGAVAESKIKLTAKTAEAKPERASAAEATAVAKAPAKAGRTRSRKKRKQPRPFTNRKDGSQMIYVPAGTFRMGSEQEGESPVHEVHVNAFYVSKYEITNQQFKQFVDSNAEWRRGRVKTGLVDHRYLRDWQNDTYPAGQADHPVVNVSWFAAKAYCEWAGGRLPTEAEWEYACRAGSTGRYCFGDDALRLEDYAWSRENSRSSSHPVGQKKANDWGLHDMHGNVWEWTSTIHRDYPYTPDDGREDPKDIVSRRVVRGGGWGNFTRNCRSADRHNGGPSYCLGGYGFRVCLSTGALSRAAAPDALRVP